MALGDCPPLQGIWGSFERGFNPAQETAVSSVIGQVALFEMEGLHDCCKMVVHDLDLLPHTLVIWRTDARLHA